MEAEEEHDNMFDKPVAFGSGKPDESALAAAMGGPVNKTASIEVSVSCDVDDGADHYIYSDPIEDKRVGDLYTTSDSVAVAATPSQAIATSM